MKPIIACAVLSLAALAACEAPNDTTMTISPGGAQRVQDIGLDAVAPSVSPQVAISAFAKYCAPYPANPRGTRAAVQADGYELFVSGTLDDLDMFVSPDVGPVVGTGNNDDADVCMVFFKEGQDLSSVVAGFVRQKHGADALQLPNMDTPDGEAENVWVAATSPPVIYFTLVQTQPGLGRIEAIALATE